MTFDKYVKIMDQYDAATSKKVLEYKAKISALETKLTEIKDAEAAAYAAEDAEGYADKAAERTKAEAMLEMYKRKLNEYNMKEAFTLEESDNYLKEILKIEAGMEIDAAKEMKKHIEKIIEIAEKLEKDISEGDRVAIRWEQLAYPFGGASYPGGARFPGNGVVAFGKHVAADNCVKSFILTR